MKYHKIYAVAKVGMPCHARKHYILIRSTFNIPYCENLFSCTNISEAHFHATIKLTYQKRTLNTETLKNIC